MFELRDLSFAYPGREMLFAGLNLCLPTNERLLLCGENGSGKSTLLMLLCNKLQALRGKITRPDKDLFYLPQNPENRILGINLTQDLQIWQMAGLDVEMVRSHSLLMDFDSTIWSLALGELSKGTKQAYLLSIALCLPQCYLVLDEPFTALDERRMTILSEILEQRQEMLIVSHVKPLFSIHKTLHLEKGKIS